jgi:hypothetical protein
LPNLYETISFDIFINGIYESETHKLLESRIPLNGIFLDIGANIGSIILQLCKGRSNLQCLAVEASPWVFNFLE